MNYCYTAALRNVTFTRGIGHPDSFNPSANGDVLHSIELLYVVPWVLMGVLSVVDKLIVSLYTKSLSADITEICL